MKMIGNSLLLRDEVKEIELFRVSNRGSRCQREARLARACAKLLQGIAYVCRETGEQAFEAYHRRSLTLRPTARVQSRFKRRTLRGTLYAERHRILTH